MIDKCIICGREIQRRKGKGNGGHLKSTRHKESVTCSKNCSRIYKRVYRRARRIIKSKLKWKEQKP